MMAVSKNKTTVFPQKRISSWRNKFYKWILPLALHIFSHAGWVTHSTLFENKNKDNKIK